MSLPTSSANLQSKFFSYCPIYLANEHPGQHAPVSKQVLQSHHVIPAAYATHESCICYPVLVPKPILLGRVIKTQLSEICSGMEKPREPGTFPPISRQCQTWETDNRCYQPLAECIPYKKGVTGQSYSNLQISPSLLTCSVHNTNVL